MKFLRRAEPIDTDIVLIMDYLTRGLEPAEMTAVKTRLMTDYAFYEKVAPVIKVWRLPSRYFSVQPTLPGATPMPLPPTVWSRRMPRLMWVAAAVVVVFLGAKGYGRYLTFTERRQDQHDLQVQRAPSNWVKTGETVETGPGEILVAETSRGTRVAVRGESRIKYQAMLKESPIAGFMWVTLDGEAAFEVSPTEGIVQLKTWAGQVNFEKGSYAIRCAPGCSAMLVTVGAGLATLVADTTKPGLVLHSGEKGQLPRNGVAEKVMTGGDDWPVLTTVKEKELPAVLTEAQRAALQRAKP